MTLPESERSILVSLLWFALQRLTNREQKDVTLTFRMRRNEVSQDSALAAYTGTRRKR
jgi:hypothetical protein